MGMAEDGYHLEEIMAKDKKWIQKALGQKGDKGKLHRALGVPEGKKIPKKKIAMAAKKPGKLGQMGRMAKTLSSLRKKK